MEENKNKPLNLPTQFQDFNSGWRYIQPVIEKITGFIDVLSGNNQQKLESFAMTKMEHSISYSIIYNMSTQKSQNFDSLLYSKYNELIKGVLQEKVLEPLQQCNQEQLLAQFVNKWEIYKNVFVKLLQKMFSYLERCYIQHNQLPTLTYISYSSFKKQVYNHLKKNIIKLYIQELDKDRNDQTQFSRSILQNVCNIILSLNYNWHQSDNNMETYKEFENEVIDNSKKYYQQQYNIWSNKLGCAEYLNNIKNLYEKETQRVSQCLQNQYQQFKVNTISELKKLYLEIFLKNYKQQLLEKENGFIYMIKNLQEENLQLVYELYLKLDDKFDQIKQKFNQHCQLEGQNLFKQKEQEKIKSLIQQQTLDQEKGLKQENTKQLAGPQADFPFLNDIFKFYDKYENLIKRCFNNNVEFVSQFKSALELCLNIEYDQSQGIPELLSYYSDSILRKNSNSKMNENEYEFIFERIQKIFNALQQKDVFIQIYQMQLAERLLLEVSESDEFESLLIAKLKLSCGSLGIKSLEGMIQDIKLSQENKQIQQQWLSEFKFETNIKVLCDANWPIYKQTNFTTPAEILKAQQQFEQQYQKKQQYHNLKWINSVSTINLYAYYPSKKYEIQMSLVQGSIMLLFTSQETELTVEQIKEKLGIDMSFLKLNLQKLSIIKNKELLVKNPPYQECKEIKDQDQFKINKNMQNKSIKFKIQAVKMEEKVKPEQIVENREHAIEASIVRVLKSRKQMIFNDLVQEVYNLLKQFKPDLKQIKKKIDSLIDRDYLERDSQNMNNILYKN